MKLERLSEIMTKSVVHTVDVNSSVQEAAATMKDVGTGCLVVIEKSRLTGIITERDIVQRVVAVKKLAREVRVSDVMSKPVLTVGPEALIADAAKIMMQNKIRRLVVAEGVRILGIVTVTDFAKMMYKKSASDPMLAAMARAAQLMPG
ncbi:MAG TPA: CBS domain-containing protein [Nitrososphaerales archaeon]